MTAQQSHASVLLIEDHRDIAEMVGSYLESRGYIIDFAEDGVTGLHLAVVNDYDAIVLDLMLPGLDGLSVCRKLREEARRDTPLLMLTARDTQQDKLTGLDAGADDYLVKPFDIRELEARVRALVRRRRGQLAAEVLTVADLSLDTGTLEVSRAGRPLRWFPAPFVCHRTSQAELPRELISPGSGGSSSPRRAGSSAGPRRRSRF